ncbi:MAG: zinc ribbon domain-containing protein [Planctomycetaceae bacterium]|nr:zinc ribbon domain-containing protein [Planctomycetaceae bacterium]
MPLFEFRCRECGHEFEQLVRAGESPLCPSCSRATVDKLMSAAAARTSGGRDLPLAGGCPPSDAPPCGPGCCRIS